MSDNEQKDIADEEIGGEEFLDEEFEDEAWEEDSDGEEVEDSAAPVAKKKSSKFNLILIAVVVLGGGGFFMMKSGGNAPVPVETQQPALPEMAAAPAQEQAQEVAQSEAAKPEDKEQKLSGGFLNDPSAFEKIEQMHEEMQFEDYSQDHDTEAWRLGNEEGHGPIKAPSVNGNIAQAPATEPLTPLPETPVQQAAAQPAALVPPVVQSDLPPPNFPKAQDIMIPVAKATAQAQPQSQPQAHPQKLVNGQNQVDTNSIDKRLTDLGGRMDGLEKALESLEIPAISGKEIADLKAALARLEGKVDGLSKSGGSIAAAPVSAPVQKKAKVMAPKEQAPSPAKVRAESVSWVLKSAQPGKAIVSKAGQAEVYSVSIGDRLEGIGKITSVEQKDGMWVVQGSAGKITQ